MVRVGDYEIVRCVACGLVYVEGAARLGRTRDLYSSSYFKRENPHRYGYEDYVADRPIHWRNAQDILGRLERCVARSARRLLDVGCAHGFFLEAARERGWTTFGVDVSPDAVEYARFKLGLTVTEGEVEDCGLAPGSLDVVSLIGSIEHLADPMKTVRAGTRIERIARWLQALRADRLRLKIPTNEMFVLARRVATPV